MTTDTMIEQRMVALENAVADLQQRLANDRPAANWLEQITGSFKDEPAFQEVLELGRAIRMAQR